MFVKVATDFSVLVTHVVKVDTAQKL
uniref:Uncharacterized protein n=1 Tax=Arundo donax TaxID=35708 RepID=A0A0A9FQB5_ARUDO